MKVSEVKQFKALCNICRFVICHSNHLKTFSENFSVCLYLQSTELLISKKKCNYFHKYVYSCYFTKIIQLFFKNSNTPKEVVIMRLSDGGGEGNFGKT